MDIYLYIKLVQKEYAKESRVDQQMMIDNFIESYDDNFNKINTTILNAALNNAFEAIKKDNLFALRALIDNYPILQKKGSGNDTLLHEAVKDNNYYLTKFLIIRGINLATVNSQYQTALIIAEEEQNSNISCLLRKAGAR